MRALTFAVVLLVTIAGVSAAQSAGAVETQVEVFLEDPGPVLKVLETRLLAITVNYRYGQGGYSMIATPIALEVVASPAWALAHVDPEAVSVATPPAATATGTTVQAVAVLNITVLNTGKAFEKGTFEVRASAAENGNLAASEGTASRETSPDYFSVLNLSAPQRLVVASGGKATRVPLHIENRGNAPTEIQFVLVNKPEFSVAVMPDRLLLDSPLDGGPTGVDVAAAIRTPWNINDDGPLEIKVRSTHATKPNLEGDDPGITIQIDGRALTPAAGATITLLTLAGLAVVRPARRPHDRT